MSPGLGLSEDVYLRRLVPTTRWDHGPSLLHLQRLKSQHHGKSSSLSPTHLSSPIMASASGLTLSHLPSSPGARRPPLLWGSCSCFSFTPAHEVRFSPLPRTWCAPRLAFCAVGKLLASFTVGDMASGLSVQVRLRFCWACTSDRQSFG